MVHTGGPIYYYYLRSRKETGVTSFNCKQFLDIIMIY